MEEWKKVRKLLSGKIRLLEFIAAMPGVSAYKIAKELERKGLIDNYRTVIIDFIRLTDKKWLKKNRGISTPIYKVIRVEKEEKRPRKKIIQVNYDYIIPLFMKEFSIKDKQLIEKTKEAILEMVSTWKLSVKEATETCKKIIEKMDVETFLAGIVMAAVINSNKMSLKEKEEIVLKISEKLTEKIMKDPLFLVELLYMYKLTLQRKEDIEKLSAGIAATFSKAIIEAFEILLKPLGFKRKN